MDEPNLQEKIKLLEEENKELKEKLKKYTAPVRHKNYYESHKDDIIQKTKEYKNSLTP